MSLIVELEYKLIKLSIMGKLSYLHSSLSWGLGALLLAVQGCGEELYSNGYNSNTKLKMLQRSCIRWWSR
jgi:hypothetical protein